MIDFLSLAANLLWVLGLSILLAALSWANWRAKTSFAPLRHMMARPSIRRALDFGLALFCAGLAATAHRGWEKALWALLALAFLVLTIRNGRYPAGEGKNEPLPEESRDREPGPPG